jgi:glycosyl transferase family 25
LDHPRLRIFPAIRLTELAGFSTLGTRGCFLSHMAVLEQALLAGDESVIICEDDLGFSPDFLSRLPPVLNIIEREECDIFYMGYTSGQIGVVVEPEANIFCLPPTHGVIGSLFYILRGKAIADFTTIWT